MTQNEPIGPPADLGLPEEAPDLSVHFFDHHGGPEDAAETHLGTVSVPGYFWDYDSPRDLGELRPSRQ